jgi:hypothetical protein
VKRNKKKEAAAKEEEEAKATADEDDSKKRNRWQQIKGMKAVGALDGRISGAQAEGKTLSDQAAQGSLGIDPEGKPMGSEKSTASATSGQGSGLLARVAALKKSQDGEPGSGLAAAPGRGSGLMAALKKAKIQEEDVKVTVGVGAAEAMRNQCSEKEGVKDLTANLHGWQVMIDQSSASVEALQAMVKGFVAQVADSKSSEELMVRLGKPIAGPNSKDRAEIQSTLSRIRERCLSPPGIEALLERQHDVISQLQAGFKKDFLDILVALRSICDNASDDARGFGNELYIAVQHTEAEAKAVHEILTGLEESSNEKKSSVTSLWDGHTIPLLENVIGFCDAALKALGDGANEESLPGIPPPSPRGDTSSELLELLEQGDPFRNLRDGFIDGMEQVLLHPVQEIQDKFGNELKTSLDGLWNETGNLMRSIEMPMSRPGTETEGTDGAEAPSDDSASSSSPASDDEEGKKRRSKPKQPNLAKKVMDKVKGKKKRHQLTGDRDDRPESARAHREVIARIGHSDLPNMKTRIYKLATNLRKEVPHKIDEWKVQSQRTYQEMSMLRLHHQTMLERLTKTYALLQDVDGADVEATNDVLFQVEICITPLQVWRGHMRRARQAVDMSITLMGDVLGELSTMIHSLADHEAVEQNILELCEFNYKTSKRVATIHKPIAALQLSERTARLSATELKEGLKKRFDRLKKDWSSCTGVMDDITKAQKHLTQIMSLVEEHEEERAHDNKRLIHNRNIRRQDSLVQRADQKDAALDCFETFCNAEHKYMDRALHVIEKAHEHIAETLEMAETWYHSHANVELNDAEEKAKWLPASIRHAPDIVDHIDLHSGKKDGGNKLPFGEVVRSGARKVMTAVSTPSKKSRNASFATGPMPPSPSSAAPQTPLPPPSNMPSASASGSSVLPIMPTSPTKLGAGTGLVPPVPPEPSSNQALPSFPEPEVQKSGVSPPSPPSPPSPSRSQNVLTPGLAAGRMDELMADLLAEDSLPQPPVPPDAVDDSGQDTHGKGGLLVPEVAVTAMASAHSNFPTGPQLSATSDMPGKRRAVAAVRTSDPPAVPVTATLTTATVASTSAVVPELPMESEPEAEPSQFLDGPGDPRKPLFEGPFRISVLRKKRAAFSSRGLVKGQTAEDALLTDEIGRQIEMGDTVVSTKDDPQARFLDLEEQEAIDEMAAHAFHRNCILEPIRDSNLAHRYRIYAEESGKYLRLDKQGHRGRFVTRKPEKAQVFEILPLNDDNNDGFIRVAIHAKGTRIDVKHVFKTMWHAGKKGSIPDSEVRLKPCSRRVLSVWTFYLCKFPQRPQWGRAAFSRELMGATVVLMFLIHGSVTQSTLTLLQCDAMLASRNEADQGITRHVLNPNIICYEGRHLLFVFTALSGLIVWTAGVPYVGYRLLKKNKNKLHHDVPTKEKYGFLCSGFEMRHYYWEIVIIVRKTVVNTLAATSLAPNTVSRLPWYLVVAIFSTAYHLRTQPFEKRSYQLLDRLERMAIYCWVTSVLLVQVVIVFDISQNVNLACLFMIMATQGVLAWLITKSLLDQARKTLERALRLYDARVKARPNRKVGGCQAKLFGCVRRMTRSAADQAVLKDICLHFKVDPPSTGLYVRIRREGKDLRLMEAEMLKKVQSDVLDVALRDLKIDSMPWNFQEVFLRQCFFVNYHNLVKQPIASQRLGKASEILNPLIFKGELTFTEFYAAFRVVQRLFVQQSLDAPPHARLAFLPWKRLLADWDDYQLHKAILPLQQTYDVQHQALKTENEALDKKLMAKEKELRELKSKFAPSRPASAASTRESGYTEADAAAEMLLQRLQAGDTGTNAEIFSLSKGMAKAKPKAEPAPKKKGFAALAGMFKK